MTKIALIRIVADGRFHPDPISQDTCRSSLQDMPGTAPLMGGSAAAFGRSVQRFGVNRSWCCRLAYYWRRLCRGDL